MSKAPPKKNKPAIDPAESFEANEVDESTESNLSVATVGATAESNAPLKSIAREYKNQGDVDHDLFKLTVAKMKKNVSWNDSPEIVDMEHCHMFHTVDSSGKRLDQSSAIGGHFHPIKVVAVEGQVPRLEVGPARKWVMKKKNGALVRTAVPIVLVAEFNDDENGNSQPLIDNHSHGAVYLGSEKIKLRQANMEAAKFESALKLQREPAVDGVFGS